MLDFRDLLEVLSAHRAALQVRVPGFDIGGQPFTFGAARHLMGVINLSPDSWYTESVCTSTAQAIARGQALRDEGAALVDLGAESTLPEARRVPPDEQRDLLLPVVSSLSRQGIVVSVESYHAEVLEAAALAGARVFNLTGVQDEAEVLKLAHRFEAAVVLCYVQGTHVRAVSDFQITADMTGALVEHYRERTARAAAAGVPRLILDPGLGFYYRNLEDSSLRVRYQLQTFLHSFRLRELGYPILNILPHAPEVFGLEGRRAAEPFFAVLALLGLTDYIRTHEVAAVARARDALAQWHRGQE